MKVITRPCRFPNFPAGALCRHSQPLSGSHDPMVRSCRLEASEPGPQACPRATRPPPCPFTRPALPSVRALARVHVGEPAGWPDMCVRDGRGICSHGCKLKGGHASLWCQQSPCGASEAPGRQVDGRMNSKIRNPQQCPMPLYQVVAWLLDEAKERSLEMYLWSCHFTEMFGGQFKLSIWSSATGGWWNSKH